MIFSFFSTAARPDVALRIGSTDEEGDAMLVDPERVQAIFLEAAEQKCAAGRVAVLGARAQVPGWSMGERPPPSSGRRSSSPSAHAPTIGEDRCGGESLRINIVAVGQ
jgi:hypothetical protein